MSNPNALQVQYDAVKFLPQSLETNKANARERRGEEKQYLLGTFEGLDGDGTADCKKLLRCWFTQTAHLKAAWKLQEAGFGVLVVGQYTESETDYGTKTLSLSNCYLPRYNDAGKFEVEQEDGNKVTFEGKAGEFVRLTINAKVVLRAAPKLEGSTRPAKAPIGLKARHAAQKEAAQTPATTANIG